MNTQMMKTMTILAALSLSVTVTGCSEPREPSAQFEQPIEESPFSGDEFEVVSRETHGGRDPNGNRWIGPSLTVLRHIETGCKYVVRGGIHAPLTLLANTCTERTDEHVPQPSN